MKLRKTHVVSCKQCSTVFDTRGNGKYCSDDCRHLNQYKANMERPEYRLKKLMAGANFRANNKALPFDLTLKYLIELWEKSGGCCAITKRRFFLASPGKYSAHPNAPSIDRVIPEKGYTQGNVRLVTYQVNVALSEFGIDSLLSLARDILDNHK